MQVCGAWRNNLSPCTFGIKRLKSWTSMTASSGIYCIWLYQPLKAFSVKVPSFVCVFPNNWLLETFILQQSIADNSATSRDYDKNYKIIWKLSLFLGQHRSLQNISELLLRIPPLDKPKWCYSILNRFYLICNEACLWNSSFHKMEQNIFKEENCLFGN